MLCGASLLQGLPAMSNHPTEQQTGDLRPLTQSPAMSADSYISNPDGSRGWAVLFAHGTICIFLC